MCQGLSAPTTASGLSQEEFLLAAAVGRAMLTRVLPRRASEVGASPSWARGHRRIPATHCHCLHSLRSARRVAAETHTLNGGRERNHPIVERISGHILAKDEDKAKQSKRSFRRFAGTALLERDEEATAQWKVSSRTQKQMTDAANKCRAGLFFCS